MADVHEPEVRSYNMSQIKGKNTKPEIEVRRFLHSKGFRFRIHYNILPGRPDIVLPKYKTVIFINGCFWHGHTGCKYFKLPETRADWWKKKIFETKKRDKRKYAELKKSDWKVLIIWECEIKHKKEQILESLLKSLQI